MTDGIKLGKYSFPRIRNGTFLEVTYMFLMIFLTSAWGIWLIKDEQIANVKVCCYGFVMFFFILMPLLGTSGAMYSLRSITPDDVRNGCESNEIWIDDMSKDATREWHQNNRKMGPLMNQIMRMAHEFDQRTENLLDQSMCTDICPCYNKMEYAKNS